MNTETLARATGSTFGDAAKYFLPLEEVMGRYRINSVKQRAAFLATLSVESVKLSKVEESLYYKDPARLANIYQRVFHNIPRLAEPYVRDSAKLGELLYQGYWGRGLIQLTWKSNYQACGDDLGYDYVANPDMLTQPTHAALSAGWFWETHDCNEPASRGDMDTVTLRVNGKKKMHLAERKAAYQRALAVLGA